jgi:hypothetical protein
MEAVALGSECTPWCSDAKSCEKADDYVDEAAWIR